MKHARTLLHREGEDAFHSSTQTLPPSIDSVPQKSSPKSYPLQSHVRDLCQNLQQSRKEQREREQRLQQQCVMRSAEPVLEACPGLAKLPCKWTGTVSSCPSIAAICTPSTSRLDDVECPLMHLADAWAKRHVGVMAAKNEKTSSRSACLQEGYCHCSRGSWVLRLENRFWIQASAKLKEALAAKPDRQQLLNGDLLYAWVSPATAIAGVRMVFTYVAMQYMKPWCPTFLLTVPLVSERGVCTTLADKEENALLDQLGRLETTEGVLSFLVKHEDTADLPAFRTARQLISTLDRSRVWWLKVLRCSSRITPMKRGEGVFMAMVTDSPGFVQVWRGEEDCVLRRKKSTADLLAGALSGSFGRARSHRGNRMRKPEERGER
eukprot:1902085-Amphidinium_carterae.3